ncbi:hypothetical protein [Sphingopyxis indica]|uniref:Uncharacterized protein n=1 Tax=Sphingopyxis indica TaxID=436663 RepID=A0A239KNF8_9SPHN|nr:hypothetical protein [Sphingopyxis indica]SNT19208.1 hypothetical protein SAMN06295955_11540 [Sphingopyxis indica]
MPIRLLSILSGTGKLFRKAFEWIADDPWRLFVIVAAVLAFMLWRADGMADKLQFKLDREIAAHAETLKSVKTLSDALEQKNAESMARAKALEDARSEAAQAQAAADRRYRSTQARIDVLRAAVGQNEGVCDTPGEVTDALSGL